MSSDARPTRSWAAVLVLWVLLTAVGVAATDIAAILSAARAGHGGAQAIAAAGFLAAASHVPRRPPQPPVDIPQCILNSYFIMHTT